MRGDTGPEGVTLCWGGFTLVKEEETGPGKESGCTSSSTKQTHSGSLGNPSGVVGGGLGGFIKQI